MWAVGVATRIEPQKGVVAEGTMDDLEAPRAQPTWEPEACGRGYC